MKKNKNKSKNKKRVIIGIIIIFVIFLLFNIIKKLINTSPLVYTIMDTETYYDLDNGKGTLIYNEIPIYLNKDKDYDIKYLGTRARVDENILELDKDLKTYFTNISNSKSKGKIDFNDFINDVYDSNLGNIELSTHYSEEEIEYAKKVLEKNMIYTYDSLYIKENLDGYESLLSFDDDLDFSQDLYTRAKSELSGFKLVDNRTFYLKTEIPLKETYEDDIDKFYNLVVDGVELTGKLIKVSNSSLKTNLVFKLTSNFEELMDLRYVDVSIINSRVESVKLPKDAIFEKKGYEGIYIANKEGTITFRPVEVLSTVGEYVYVRKDGKELTYSLDLYDDIIIDADYVEDVIKK